MWLGHGVTYVVLKSQRLGRSQEWLDPCIEGNRSATFPFLSLPLYHYCSQTKKNFFNPLSFSKRRVTNRDHLPPDHRNGFSLGAEGTQCLGLKETTAHQNFQAPHPRQPHLPQPLLRLQKPKKETRVSFRQLFTLSKVLMRVRKVKWRLRKKRVHSE